MKEILSRLVAGRLLDREQMERAVGLIMDGEVGEAQAGAFLAALSTRGETVEELVAAVRVMRQRCIRVECDGLLLDTCGTGGDGLGTFNISTAVSFVAAAAGVKVAKHGNRAASGKVGAADVLEALGVRIDLGPEAAARAIREVGICFLFAPIYHPAMRHIGPVRRALGFRTLFNLTGPLCNPAGVRRQLVGLFDAAWMEPVAEALLQLGCERAMVVHGGDGSDEIALSAETAVIELRHGKLERYSIDPGALGLGACSPEDIAGGDAAGNAGIIREIFSGKPGPAADIVALNAAAALYVAGSCPSLEQGLERSRGLLAGGRAEAKLQDLIEFGRRVDG